MQKLRINYCIFLFSICFAWGFFLTNKGYAGCTHFSGAEKPVCPKSQKSDSLQRAWNIDPTGVFSVYRLVNKGEGQRRCRLHPTCSYFTVQGIRKFGLIKGLFFGFARAQMEHSNQRGYLLKSVGEDGRFIYLDPLENWIHDSD